MIAAAGANLGAATTLAILPNFVSAILVFILGSIIGSFLNVLILRLPSEKKITGRSHCMHCRHHLAPLDLVPIFSFLFLSGRCRYCRAKISGRYPIIEALSGFLALAAFLAIMPAAAQDYLVFSRAAFIIFVLIVVFMVDFEHFLILDKIVLPASLMLLIINFAVDIFQNNSPLNSLAVSGFFSALAAALFFGAIYFFSRGRWMGFGDVKFSLFLGLATPFPFILVNIFLAFFLGSCIGIMLLISGTKKLKSQVPFGTFLSVSTLIVLFFGPQLLNWYLRLIDLRYLAIY